MNCNSSRSQCVSKRSVVGKHGIVSAQCFGAARAGADVLEAGGNAVDAAIAASFVSGVLEPWMSGPLGGGAMLIAKPGNHPEAILFNPRSPLSLETEEYALEENRITSDVVSWPAVKGDINVTGPRSVATPGLVAGLERAHTRHGTMPWADLLVPAIEAANNGFPLDWYSSLIIATKAKELVEDSHAARMFLKEGVFPKTTFWTDTELQTVPLPDAGKTLERLAVAGPDDFYHGEISNVLIKDAQDKGICLQHKDLKSYQTSVIPALSMKTGSSVLYATPGLTGGPTLLDIRQRFLSKKDRGLLGQRSAILEGIKQRVIEMGHSMQNIPGECTTHISVIDGKGNAVSLTQTLLSVFGACVLAPRTGFLFNNGILWFDPRLGGPNSIEPNRMCLMNVSPVIGETSTIGRFAMGAVGGRKILPAMFQITHKLLDQNASLEEAISMPRIDPISNRLTVADSRISELERQLLQSESQLQLITPTAFPLSFGGAVGAMHCKEGFVGFTEPHSPWSDSVAPNIVRS